jgi:membrane protease YdiL (CAAX protease family)
LEEPVTTTKPSKTVPLAGMIIAAVFSVALYVLLYKAHLTGLNGLIYSRFVFWAVVVFLWWFAAQFEKRPLLIWKEKQSGLKFIFKWTVLLFILILAANLISNITILLGFHQNKELIRQMSRFMTGRTLLILFISVTAGVTEEIIFRGYILTRLSLLFKNQYIPIVISALIFSGMHYAYHSAHEQLFTFLVGLIMAAHYKRYGNLKPLIIAHFLVDWAGLTFLHYFVK